MSRPSESQPENVETHVNLAYALLCAGEYERGWREYEWRLKSEKHPGWRFNRPFWNGEDIRDRTILLHTEQGFGDNLQFLRFARHGQRTCRSCAGALRSALAQADRPL